MTLKQGTLVPIERDRADIVGTAPRVVYLASHATIAGRYVLTTELSERTAFLMKTATPNRYKLDDVTDDKALYLVTATRVLI